MEKKVLGLHKAENRKKMGMSLILGSLVVLLVLGLVIATAFFYQMLQKQMYGERQSHLTELTVKISEVLDMTIETMQSKALSARRVLERTDDLAEDALPSSLKEIADVIDFDGGLLIAVNSQGRFYSSDGTAARWVNTEDLIEEEMQPVIREITINGEKNYYMVFFQRLETPIALKDGKTELTHVALMVLLDDMDEAFSITIFENNCFTYLVNQDGRRLYKQTFSGEFIEEYNVLNALKKETFYMGGSAEQLEEAVKQRQMSCMEFASQEQKENYFVSTVPLSNSDWTVLLFVPTRILAANTNGFTNYVITYFAIVAGVVTIIFVLLIFMVMTSKNDRQMLARQEAANVLLAQAAEEAKSASVAKSEFLSHMSHDIRTPINGIVGMTNIAIKNVNDPERVADCLHKITGASNHLLTLINDVLDMSRIESGRIEIAGEPMDIRTLLDSCSSIIIGQLMSRRVDFVREWGEFEHPCVLGDELHLRQVFINILGNAVKFTPDGGKITFRAQETSSSEDKVAYRFEFEDTGIGMSEEFLTKIFDAFSQENAGSRTNYKGTGLGMAISKQFMDLMGGSISVTSRLGEGSCFVVELEFAIDREKQKERKTVTNTESFDGMKILLVEDNELNLEIAQEILEDKGIRVSSAENGQVAVDLFTGSPAGTFDAILMDVMMPVMNGFEATRAIRASAHPEAASVPIIAMTANAYAEDVAAAMEAGMDDHVAKPIDLQRLFTVLGHYRKS